MVYKKIIVILLVLAQILPLSAYGELSNFKIHLTWNGSKNNECQTITQSFLTDLRSIAGDIPIELDLELKKTISEIESSVAGIPVWNLDLSCEPPVLFIKEIETESPKLVQLTYSKKAQGFDSIDWLEFQKAFLQGPPQAKKLKFSDLAVSAIKKEASVENVVASSTIKKPFYKKWWVWTIAGAFVGVGSYFLIQSQNRSTKIEIQVQ